MDDSAMCERCRKSMGESFVVFIGNKLDGRTKGFRIYGKRSVHLCRRCVTSVNRANALLFVIAAVLSGGFAALMFFVSTLWAGIKWIYIPIATVAGLFSLSLVIMAYRVAAKKDSLDAASSWAMQVVSRDDIAWNIAELEGAMSHWKAEGDIDSIVSALLIEDDNLRRSAATALHTFPEEKVIEKIVLGAKDSRVTALALKSLRGFKGAEDILPLIKSTHQLLSTRIKVVGALGELGEAIAIPSLWQYLAQFGHICEDLEAGVAALVQLGLTAHDAMQHFLTVAISHPNVGRILASVGKHLNADFVEPLLAVLVDNSSSSERRLMAVRALSVVGDGRAVEPLLSVSTNDPFHEDVETGYSSFYDEHYFKTVYPIRDAAREAVEKIRATSQGVHWERPYQQPQL